MTDVIDLRKRELEKSARAQIIAILEADLDGDENLKELWEECRNEDETKIAREELHRIIDFLRINP